MSEHAERFISYLGTLQDKERGALATLRHSLAFAPGGYPKAYPYVERFVSPDWSAQDARRLAMYVVAGLYSRHPMQRDSSFATAFGELFQQRDESPSIEQRFVSLLGADAQSIADHLRQAINLLFAADIGLDYRRLLADLSLWLNPAANRDWIRQRWAREFYRAIHQ